MTLISIAKSQIGTKESNGGDDKYIKWFGGFALTVSWCAIFVSWCADQYGVLGKAIPKFASCDAGMKWFIDKGQFKPSKAYGGTYVPKQDDIIFFSEGHNVKDATHVGIVDSVGNNVVHTVEGNSADSVRSRTYDLADKFIIGYGVPKYKKISTILTKLVGGLSTTPTLQRDSKGAVVKEVQKVLIANGYSCGKYGADGEYGPDTEEAVKQFQEHTVGLTKPDGIITAKGKTWQALLNL